MNYIDLFSGIGGFALGSRMAGIEWENHYASDVEKFANAVYEKNFPNSIQLGDIRKIDPSKLPEGEWILSAGFPCQDISIAGKGAGIEGDRSGLWFEAWRIIRDIQPKYAILENVPALTFRGLNRVLGSLAEIGYDAEWQTLSASQFGAPHLRKRIWIVAYPNSEPIREQQIEKCRCKASTEFGRLCKKISNANCQGKSDCSINVEALADTDGINGDNGRYGASEDRFKKASKIQICEHWAFEPPVGRVANGIPRRMDRLKGLGNSIVPQIAEYLFRLLGWISE